MEAKFTPGPWEVLNARKEDWLGRPLDYWTVTADGGDKWLCASPEWDPEHDEESTANARLIAAAPELLEALSKMVDRITYYAELKSGEIPNIEDWAYTYNSGDMIAARAAIAKATGEQA